MSRNECEGRTKISIFWLKQNGHLIPEISSYSGSLNWTYTYTGEDAGSLGYEIRFEPQESDNKVGFMRLMYITTDRWTGEKTEIDYKIPIVVTTCNYGGIRFWFQCPLSRNGFYCGRRVGVLYKISKYYGCRHCGDLVYADQNESKRRRGVISDPDLQKAYRAIRRFCYKNKPTKKYLKYLKMEERSDKQWAYWLTHLASK